MGSRIVDVSTKPFARRGIDGVSIAGIGLAAGVSKANVTHHFERRQAEGIASQFELFGYELSDPTGLDRLSRDLADIIGNGVYPKPDVTGDSSR